MGRAPSFSWLANITTYWALIGFRPKLNKESGVKPFSPLCEQFWGPVEHSSDVIILSSSDSLESFRLIQMWIFPHIIVQSVSFNSWRSNVRVSLKAAAYKDNVERILLYIIVWYIFCFFLWSFRLNKLKRSWKHSAAVFIHVTKFNWNMRKIVFPATDVVPMSFSVCQMNSRWSTFSSLCDHAGLCCLNGE